MKDDIHPEGRRAVEIEVRSLSELGAQIRSLRKRKGLTQSELASWLGTTRQTIYHLETGRSTGLAIALEAVAVLGYAVVLRPRGSQRAD